MPKSDGWKNIKPMDGSNPEAEYEVRAAGGRAAAKVVKKKKALKDIFDMVLSLPAGDDLLSDDALTNAAKECARERGEELSAYEAIALAMAAKAAKGDVDAARFTRDSAGDKPTDQQRIIADVVTPADAEIAKRVAERLDKAKQSGE